MSYVTIDENVYEWEHGSYQVKNQRLSSSKPTASGDHSRTDKGAWKKEFKVTILCQNKDLTQIEEPLSDGAGKQQRDALRATYNEPGPISLITPDGDTHSVYFEGDMVEQLMYDIPQDGGYEYSINVNFIEA